MIVFVVGLIGATLCGAYETFALQIEDSANGFIAIEGRDAFEYLRAPDRLFDIAAFISVDNCPLCEQAWPAFAEAARLYRVARAHLPRRRSGSARVLRPLIFLSVRFGPGSEGILARYSLKTVPYLLYSSAEEARMESGPQLAEQVAANSLIVNTSLDAFSLSRLLNWLNARAGENVQTAEKGGETLFAQIAVLAFAFVCACFAWRFWAFFQSERVWIFSGLLIFAFGAGGFASYLISGNSFFDSDGGKRVFVKRGTRMQTGAEGVIVMGALLGAGASLIIAVRLLKDNRRKASPIVAAALLLVAIQFILSVENIFRSKNFYNPIFFPPKYYIRGPLINDQTLAF